MFIYHYVVNTCMRGRIALTATSLSAALWSCGTAQTAEEPTVDVKAFSDFAPEPETPILDPENSVLIEDIQELFETRYGLEITPEVAQNYARLDKYEKLKALSTMVDFRRVSDAFTFERFFEFTPEQITDMSYFLDALRVQKVQPWETDSLESMFQNLEQTRQAVERVRALGVDEVPNVDEMRAVLSQITNQNRAVLYNKCGIYHFTGLESGNEILSPRIVEELVRNLKGDDGRPLAVFFRSDYDRPAANGTLEYLSDVVESIVDNGYALRMYQVGSDDELFYRISQQRMPIRLMPIAAHSDHRLMQLGRCIVSEDFNYREVSVPTFFRGRDIAPDLDLLCFVITDMGALSRVEANIQHTAVIPLIGCRCGEGGEGAINIANGVAGTLRGRTVHSSMRDLVIYRGHGANGVPNPQNSWPVLNFEYAGGKFLRMNIPEDHEYIVRE